MKYYLRGISIGVIVATLILSVTFFINRDEPMTDDEVIERAEALGMVMANQLPGNETLSEAGEDTEPGEDAGDGAVDAGADSGGSGVSGTDQSVGTPDAGKDIDSAGGGTKNGADSASAKDKDDEASTKDGSDAAEDGADAAGSGSDSEKDKGAAKAAGSTPAEGPAAAGKPAQKTVERVEISIAGGEFSDAVCEKLEEAGIIEDAEDFNEYLARKKYDDKISPGTYTLEKGADYDDIIKEITKDDN